MKVPLYERVVLLKDVPEEGLKKGDVVTTVEFLEARRDLPNAYYVEAFNALGKTIAVFIVEEDNLEALTANDVLQVRHNLSPADKIVVDEASMIEDASGNSIVMSENAITIELPDAIFEQKGTTPEQLKLQLAIFLFQQEFFSLGKASEFTGLHQSQFQRELANRQISVHYDVEDYRKDITTITKHKGSLTISPRVS